MGDVILLYECVIKEVLANQMYGESSALYMLCGHKKYSFLTLASKEAKNRWVYEIPV